MVWSATILASANLAIAMGLFPEVAAVALAAGGMVRASRRLGGGGVPGPRHDRLSVSIYRQRILNGGVPPVQIVHVLEPFRLPRSRGAGCLHLMMLLRNNRLFINIAAPCLMLKHVLIGFQAS